MAMLLCREAYGAPGTFFQINYDLRRVLLEPLENITIDIFMVTIANLCYSWVPCDKLPNYSQAQL
jgi:hypothetical protein